MAPQEALRALAAEIHDSTSAGICLDAAAALDASAEELSRAKDEITWLKHRLNADLDDGK